MSDDDAVNNVVEEKPEEDDLKDPGFTSPQPVRINGGKLTESSCHSLGHRPRE